MRTALFYAMLACALGMSYTSESVGQATRPEGAFSDFNNLAQADRLKIILAGMREGEAPFDNAEFRLRFSQTTTRPDGSPYRMHAEYDVRLLGNMYYMKYVAQDEKGRIDDFKMKWDGKRSFTWDRLKDNKWASGVINTIEPRNLGDLWYLGQVGVREEPPESEATRDMIENLSRMGVVDYKSEMSQENGTRKITLTIGDEHAKYELALDPDRNFVILNFRNIHISSQGKPHDFKRRVTDEFRQVDGVWIPWRVTETVFVGDKAFTDVTYAVDSARFGALTEDDLAVTFEKTTRVVDNIHFEAWLIDENGKEKMTPMLDPRSGKVLEPKDPAATRPVTY